MAMRASFRAVSLHEALDSLADHPALLSLNWTMDVELRLVSAAKDASALLCRITFATMLVLNLAALTSRGLARD